MNSSSSSGSGRSALGGSSAETSVGAPGIGARSASRGAAFDLAPALPPAHPMLKWLAIGGWGTFAAEWLLMLLVLTSLVSQGGRVEADAAPPPVAVTPRTPVRAATPSRATPPAPVVTRTTTPAPNAQAATAQANVLGMPLSPGHTVVLLDAIEKSSAWLNQSKAKLIAGLSQVGPAGGTFSIAVINNDGGRSLTPQPLTYGPAAAGRLRTALNPLRVKGTKGLGTGLDTAGKLGADQVIFITSRSDNWGAYTSFLKGKLTVNGKRIRMDVVQVNDQPVSDLRAFITGANGGQYLQIAPGSI